MFQVLERSGIQTEKAIYSKLIANIKLNGDKHKSTPNQGQGKADDSLFPQHST